MDYFRKSVSIILFLTLFVFALSFSSFAASENAPEKLYESRGGLMSVSYRGSGTGERENSVAAVSAAVKAGADMVSVAAEKNGASFFLSDTGDSFEEAAKAAEDKALLIVDGAWEARDELVSFAKEKGLLSSIALRTNESEKKIASWCKENPDVTVIGIYCGNIVFNAISHLNTAKKAGQPLVQYQSKNYFNVMYGSFTASRYSAVDGSDGVTANPRALAPMHDENLCGKRGDNIVGWDELFDRGFSVVETRNIKGLVAYINEVEESRKALESSVAAAESADTSKFSSVGAKNLSKALSEAKAVIEDKNKPLSALQSADSALRAALYVPGNENSKSSEKGALNITAGKVCFVVFFGGLILAAQVFVYKKKEKTA